jgi:hypothetical protein
LFFLFVIATLMVGATIARPPKKDTCIGVVVRSLWTSLRLVCPSNYFSCMCDGCICKCWLCNVTSNLKLYHHYPSHSWLRCDGGIPSMDIIYNVQGSNQGSN